jgi:lipid A oxidase
MRVLLASLALTAALVVAPAPAGELEIGAFGGANWAAHNVSVIEKNGVSAWYVPTWTGQSFTNPIYYGVQAIYWSDMLPDWGFGIDFTHAKAYADLTDPAIAPFFSVLEFTDGLNQLTANVFKKWDFDNGFRAYVGAGAGIGIPHVEITTTPANPIGVSSTFEYQVTGAVVQVVGGVSYRIFDHLRAFAEYKLAYQWNDARLVGGGTFSNQFVTQHLAAGLSYSIPIGDF